MAQGFGWPDLQRSDFKMEATLGIQMSLRKYFWLQAVAVTKLHMSAHMVNIKLESNAYRYTHGIAGPFLSFCVHVFPAFLNICIGLLCGQYTFWKPADAATRPRVELLSKRGIPPHPSSP